MVIKLEEYLNYFTIKNNEIEKPEMIILIYILCCKNCCVAQEVTDSVEIIGKTLISFPKRNKSKCNDKYLKNFRQVFLFAKLGLIVTSYYIHIASLETTREIRDVQKILTRQTFFTSFQISFLSPKLGKPLYRDFR